MPFVAPESLSFYTHIAYVLFGRLFPPGAPNASPVPLGITYLRAVRTVGFARFAAHYLANRTGSPASNADGERPESVQIQRNA